MKSATPQTEQTPSTQPRKVVFGGSLQFNRSKPMKNIRTMSAVCMLLATALNARSEQSYTIGIVTGHNLIANQLDQGRNWLDKVMPEVPDGTILKKFDNTKAAWVLAYYSAHYHAWIPQCITLSPGEGAFLLSPSNFDLTISGMPHEEVLPRPLTNMQPYLLSRQTNAPGSYETIVGTSPADLTKVYKWGAPGGYTLYDYDSIPGWTPSAPTTAVGEALWVIPPGAGLSAVPTNVFVTFSNHVYQSLGQANLQVQAGHVLVSGMDSDGDDGARFLFNLMQEASMHWLDLDPADSMSVGAFLQIQVLGSVYSNHIKQADTPIVLAQTLKAASGQHVIGASFPSLPVTLKTIDAYSGSNQVAHLTGQPASGLIGVGATPPSAARVILDGQRHLAVILTWDESTLITLPNAEVELADSLVVTAEGETLDGFLTSMGVTGGGGLTDVAIDQDGDAVWKGSIGISQSGSDLILNWGIGGMLQETTDFLHWNNVEGATSPFAIPMGGGQPGADAVKGFRVDFSEGGSGIAFSIKG